MNSKSTVYILCGRQILLCIYCLYTVHGTHNHFIQKKILKMGPTVLFTHLKIILLQCFSVFSFSFQFSVFSCIQTHSKTKNKGKRRQKTTCELSLGRQKTICEREGVYIVDRCSPRKSSIKAQPVLSSTQLHFLIYFVGELLLNSMQIKVIHPTYRKGKIIRYSRSTINAYSLLSHE